MKSITINSRLHINTNQINNPRASHSRTSSMQYINDAQQLLNKNTEVNINTNTTINTNATLNNETIVDIELNNNSHSQNNIQINEPDTEIIEIHEPSNIINNNLNNTNIIEIKQEIHSDIAETNLVAHHTQNMRINSELITRRRLNNNYTSEIVNNNQQQIDIENVNINGTVNANAIDPSIRELQNQNEILHDYINDIQYVPSNFLSFIRKPFKYLYEYLFYSSSFLFICIGMVVIGGVSYYVFKKVSTNNGTTTTQIFLSGNSNTPIINNTPALTQPNIEVTGRITFPNTNINIDLGFRRIIKYITKRTDKIFDYFTKKE
jgi:hypothetical protein